ncbi:hypothetical protein LTR43_007342 [Exophiala xenobiotica]|nr:hypothetical protein LTR14_008432 [Exophiala xenobiotica]KAK5477582.1 hypothetical protein LTR55_008174 [Exophiala xenobiotica]
MTFLPCSGVHRVSSNLSSSSRPLLAGTFIHKNGRGQVLAPFAGKRIYANQELIIGRDKTRCQYVIDDPYVSQKHVRIYTVVYEDDEPNEIETLVYAEDLSQNGTYWNGSLIGKGNGGYLLSDRDALRLSSRTTLVFSAVTDDSSNLNFDLVQEQEMARFRDQYVITDRLLGAGTFGRVFMAIEQHARAQVACKIVDLRKLMGKPLNFGPPDQPAAAEDVDSRAERRKVKAWGNQQKREGRLEDKLRLYFREVEILASISHPNIIGIEKVYVTENTVYMMQDLVTAGDLFSYIESKNGRLLEVEVAVIIRQILVALAFLHENNIVHRDIKPENILMTSLSAGCRVVLTDFGAARRIAAPRSRMNTVLGTREYAAPETLRQPRNRQQAIQTGYTRAVDMWSLGCVAVVLLTGGLAFCDPFTNTYSEKLARECDLRFLQDSQEWRKVRERPKDFVEKLLVLDETTRPSAEEALKHPWFSNGMHKNDFEDLYQRTIKHWHPRAPKSPLKEFQEGGITYKYMSQSSDLQDFGRKWLRRDQKPVEPPYKPFPRNMHLTFWPKRDPKRRVSDEVLKAIDMWGASSRRGLECTIRSASREEADLLSRFWSKSEDSSPRHIRARAVSPPLMPQDQSGPRRGGSIGGDGFSVNIPALVGRPPTATPQRTLFGRRARSMPPMRYSAYEESCAKVPPAANPSAGSRPGKRPEEDAARNENLFITADAIPSSPARSGNPIELHEPDGESNQDMRLETPQREHRFKRRTSTPLTDQRKKKQRGSIFDLAEDEDGDSGDGGGSPKRTTATLVNRPKAPAAIPVVPRNLYFPR